MRSRARHQSSSSTSTHCCWWNFSWSCFQTETTITVSLSRIPTFRRFCWAEAQKKKEEPLLAGTVAAGHNDEVQRRRRPKWMKNKDRAMVLGSGSGQPTPAVNDQVETEERWRVSLIFFFVSFRSGIRFSSWGVLHHIVVTREEIFVRRNCYHKLSFQNMCRNLRTL